MTSEEQYLADQAAQAREAMFQIVQELKHSVTQAVDVRTCARRNPWIATGSAVAAGFVAGAALSNRRSESGEKRPARTEAGAPPDSPAHESFPQKPGFVRGAVGTALAGIVQTLLQSFIAAAVVTAEVDPVVEEPHRPGSAPPVVPERLGKESNPFPWV